MRYKLKNVALLAVLALLAGCVTTTEGGFTEKYSPEEALQERVELARQYIGEGNWEAAKRNLKLAYEIDPNNAYVYEAFALVYQSTGEYELAEENFEKALKLDSKLSRARNNYAAFLFSQQRYKEAAKQLDIVVKDSLYSGRPLAFVNLGLCRVQLFDPEGAEEAFVRALAMDRTNSIALLEMAQLRFDAGDFANARKYYGTYRSVVRQQSARGLWLGVRLARDSGNLNDESSYALALKNLYPDSVEYEAYRRTVSP
ncbi:MAG: type IV pilus biogenesis/stability protein PilW [Gammaproteobacteria bacterium]|jgi:type IV pilus assembly protein PilF|nr:type IV pilus biogenesis/stability protein PilW [Gammaproteobacteria bacterium]MDH5171873.1 type IV pilus biogenesis/stability protein PilW [Gammaproteobacteria bacterium]